MIFKETVLKGAYLIEVEENRDERGFFARAYCLQEFQQHSLDFKIMQCSISLNKKSGTIRGMHYQTSPYEEAKLVSCTKGKIFDVIIDLRRDSATYCQWYASELSQSNHRMLYVPKGFAHGFQSLEDNSVVFYQISEFYHPECANGISWDDPLFSIAWPLGNQTISAKDRMHPLFIKNNP